MHKIKIHKTHSLSLFLTGTAFLLLCTTAYPYAGSSPSAAAEDAWMTYRYDNARSGSSPASVPLPLEVKWHFKASQPPRPAWPEPGEEMKRIQMDNALHAVSAYGMVFFASSADHTLYALDLQTGREKWHFTAQGPVRYAPSIWNKRLYFGSDDGLVYCLEAIKGNTVWTYRPGPTKEKVLGNGNMISLWPVRTSVLVDRGTVFCGAGVFPYEGIYICALDAKNGHVVWKNDTIGDREHELIFGGISPQSYLVASDKILYTPSSRAMPAAFDKKTGEFLFYLEPGGKIGGAWALLDQDHLIAGVDQSGTPAKAAYDNTGEKQEDMQAWFPGIDLVVSRDTSFTLTKDGIYALDRTQYLRLRKDQIKNLRAKRDTLQARLRDLSARIALAGETEAAALNKEREDITELISELAQVEDRLKPEMFRWKWTRANLHTLIRTGNSLFAGGDGILIGLDTENGKKRWEAQVSGSVMGLSAASGHLLASTDQGDVYCFGHSDGTPAPAADLGKKDISSTAINSDTEKYQAATAHLLARTKIKKGYALVLSHDPEALALELAGQSQLKIIALSKDAGQVKRTRETLRQKGLYGTKIIIEPWDMESLPDYFANLVIADEIILEKDSFPPEEINRILKPYGGTVVFGSLEDKPSTPGKDTLSKFMDRLKEIVPESRIQKPKDTSWVSFTRGGLDGAGSWTEEYGNPGNTACSGDRLVKGPLSVLWFGEPGSRKMVDRHAKAQSPLSMDGILFIQGEEVIMAYDAYNGTRLWERELPGAVRPRADVDGGNFSVSSAGLFVGASDSCYKLDPETGQILQQFTLPETPSSSPFRWAHVSAVGKTLFGSRSRALPHSYFGIKNVLISGSGWRPPETIPKELQDLYFSLKKRYPVPGEALLADFKRSGLLWRSMANFPDWENYNLMEGALTKRIMTSDWIFAMDPVTGKVKWIHKGQRIAHITISKDEGRLFLAESAVSSEEKRKARAERTALAQKGTYIPERERFVKKNARDIRKVFALDQETGRILWTKILDFTGCGGDTLASAAKNGVLIFFSNMGSHDAWRHQTGTLRWKRMIALSAEDGKVLWSRENNYRTRPVIVGDRIFIEPRACSLHTGKILERTHPISGANVPFEYLRPGHTCAITSASASMLFYRSACAAFTDFEKDDGLSLFGGIRPGCWISMIPAGGVLLFPEASAGCTCSFPLRGSVVLKNKAGRWPKGKVFITHGSMTPVKNFSINLGAPSDMQDREGRIWFAYPNPKTNYTYNHYPDYGVKFDLNDRVPSGLGYFSRDYRNVTLPGTVKPWLFMSGAVGITSFDIPLIDDIWGETSGTYTVRLGFRAPPQDRKGQRVFHIRIQGKVLKRDFDIQVEAGLSGKCIIKEFPGISVAHMLRIELIPQSEKPNLKNAPIINFIQAVREDNLSIAPRAGQEKAVLSPGECRRLLTKAQALLSENKKQEALNLIYSILEQSSQKSFKKEALKRIAAIADPHSLPFIAPFCRNTDPIIRDYRDLDQDLKKSATRAFIAIADRIAKKDREKSFRMLNRAMAFTSPDDLATMEEIASRLKK